MALAHPFDPVMPVCGLIYRDFSKREEAKDRLHRIWGPILVESLPFVFDQTPYYQEEMGLPLFRTFFAFERLIDPSRFFELKLESNAIEADFMTVMGQRLINLDPGILSLANLLVATCKNHYHRVPLRAGIYAHIEYVFRDGAFHALPWTYPDFRTEGHLTFFSSLRNRYKTELKKNASQRGDQLE